MKNNGYYSLLQNYLINSGVCSKHFDLTHYHLQQWDLGKPVNQGNQDYKNAENLYKRLKKAAKKVAKKKQLLLID